MRKSRCVYTRFPRAMAPIPAFRFDIAFQTVFFLKTTYKTNYKNQRRRKNTINTGLPGCPVHGTVPVTPFCSYCRRAPARPTRTRLSARNGRELLYASTGTLTGSVTLTGATCCALRSPLLYGSPVDLRNIDSRESYWGYADGMAVETGVLTKGVPCGIMAVPSEATVSHGEAP